MRIRKWKVDEEDKERLLVMKEWALKVSEEAGSCYAIASTEWEGEWSREQVKAWLRALRRLEKANSGVYSLSSGKWVVSCLMKGLKAVEEGDSDNLRLEWVEALEVTRDWALRERCEMDDNLWIAVIGYELAMKMREGSSNKELWEKGEKFLSVKMVKSEIEGLRSFIGEVGMNLWWESYGMMSWEEAKSLNDLVEE